MTNRPAQYIRLAGGRIGLRQFRPAASGAVRLVCLPYAGGQSLAFRNLARFLPAEWGVWAIDPPGHGFAQGKLLDDVEAMADAYLAHLPEELLDGGVLLGHSIGGCVAYSLAGRLAQRGTAVAVLVVCGTPPPDMRRDEEPISELDDDALLQRLIDIGGIPANLAARGELFDLFKHAIRADMKAYETFDIRAPLAGTTLLAFGGREDEICRPEHLSTWSRYCSDCRVEHFGGGHLFLQSHAEEVAERLAIIVDCLLSARQPQQGSDG